ncbi:homeobox protein abdominal-A, partial [Aplysia californica]|uniref:Homeobox protein abdominal-A n=1 Tax=Aplysia californica TaxID=6500 RepID=A0ABM0KBJ9_APLCA
AGYSNSSYTPQNNENTAVLVVEQTTRDSKDPARTTQHANNNTNNTSSSCGASRPGLEISATAGFNTNTNNNTNTSSSKPYLQRQPKMDESPSRTPTGHPPNLHPAQVEVEVMINKSDNSAGSHHHHNHNYQQDKKSSPKAPQSKKPHNRAPLKSTMSLGARHNGVTSSLKDSQKSKLGQQDQPRSQSLEVPSITIRHEDDDNDNDLSSSSSPSKQRRRHYSADSPEGTSSRGLLYPFRLEPTPHSPVSDGSQDWSAGDAATTTTAAATAANGGVPPPSSSSLSPPSSLSLRSPQNRQSLPPMSTAQRNLLLSHSVGRVGGAKLKGSCSLDVPCPEARFMSKSLSILEAGCGEEKSPGQGEQQQYPVVEDKLISSSLTRLEGFQGQRRRLSWTPDPR